MEQELKYVLPDEHTAELIWGNEDLIAIEDVSSRERIPMKATYFDTPSGKLRKNMYAYRVRSEGGITLATLKYGGSVKDGLHERQEINVPVMNKDCFSKTSTEIFGESRDGMDLIALVGDETLVSILDMDFLRRRARINYRSSIIELAIDTGLIRSGKGTCPINELELELYVGELEDLLSLGKIISKSFRLEPLNQSKLQRGLEIM